MMTMAENVNPDEIDKFSALASRWWDPRGEFKTLHAVNPLRIQFIRSHAEVDGAKILDVGCGGGILSEGLARSGASVTGIDLGGELLSVARDHASDSALTSPIAKSVLRHWLLRLPGVLTTSPVWKCWSTSRTRPRSSGPALLW